MHRRPASGHVGEVILRSEQVLRDAREDGRHDIVMRIKVRLEALKAIDHAVYMTHTISF